MKDMFGNESLLGLGPTIVKATVNGRQHFDLLNALIFLFIPQVVSSSKGIVLVDQEGGSYDEIGFPVSLNFTDQHHETVIRVLFGFFVWEIFARIDSYEALV